MKCALLILVIISSLGLGCHAAEVKRNAFSVGMPRRDVVLLMGTPDKSFGNATKEILQYQLRKDIADPYADPEPYWVFLEEGKVVKFGKAEEFQGQEKDFLDAADAQISLS